MSSINPSLSSPCDSSLFTLKDQIGEGAFGKVFEARNTKTGEIVAIKKVFQDPRYKNRELEILKAVSGCTQVSKLLQYFLTNTADGEYLHLVFERLDASLGNLIKEYSTVKAVFTDSQVKTASLQLLTGLAEIHKLGITHRDLKPQNLLVSRTDLSLQICDFGSAKSLEKDEKNVAYICSRYYRAPELIFGAKNYSEKVDCWSAGCIIAELLLQKPLFAGSSSGGQIVEMIKVLGTPSKADISAMNEDYKTNSFPLIKVYPLALLLEEFTSDSALISLIQQLLVFNPEERLSAEDALKHEYFSA